MTIMREPRAPGAPCSANEINLRVRRMERGLILSQTLTAGMDQLVIPIGRQRTPKPWLMSVLCRLGMHQGQWAYVVEGNCAQGRECERCGSVHARIRHRREWRYMGEGTCNQARVCNRCNSSDKYRIRHENWGASYSVGDDKQAHQCERCGKVEEWTLSDGD